MISINSNSLNLSIKLGLCFGIGLPSIAICVYLFQKHKNNSVDNDPNDNIIKTRQKITELKIPAYAISSIIGPQGKVIKEIQKKTNTRINFKDKTNRKMDENTSNVEPDNILVIRGASLNVGLAELEIKKLLLDLPVFLTENYFVPEYALGRIIGRNGSNIKEISALSNCKVKVLDRIPTSSFSDSKYKISDLLTDQNETRKVISFTGSFEQILYAKELIIAKVNEENNYRMKKSMREMKKDIKLIASPSDNSLIDKPSLIDKINPINDIETLKTPDLINIESYLDEFNRVSVYCTAVANPLAFWVQISSESMTSLIKLNKDMKKFYLNNSSPDLNFKTVDEIKVGQFVACLYHGNEWHRAEVLNTKPKGDSDEIDVYYVDYGESDYVKLDRLRKLDKDFYSIPLQALECILCDIKSNKHENDDNDDNNNLNDKTDWSESDLVLFEELVYSCKWKKLELEFVRFINTPYTKKVCCRLYDKSKNAFISDLMIQNGCAKSKFD